MGCEKDILISPMALHHVEAVSEIEQECFSIPWTKADFIKEIKENKLAYYFVAECENEVLGYAGLWHVVTEGHITNVAVRQSQQNKGIGALLIKRLIALGQEKEMMGLTLEVRISNIKAQRLYTRNGFKPEGFRKRYYSDTKEDAVIMWRYFEYER